MEKLEHSTPEDNKHNETPRTENLKPNEQTSENPETAKTDTEAANTYEIDSSEEIKVVEIKEELVEKDEKIVVEQIADKIAEETADTTEEAVEERLVESVDVHEEEESETIVTAKTEWDEEVKPGEEVPGKKEAPNEKVLEEKQEKEAVEEVEETNGEESPGEHVEIEAEVTGKEVAEINIEIKDIVEEVAVEEVAVEEVAEEEVAEEEVAGKEEREGEGDEEEEDDDDEVEGEELFEKYNKLSRPDLVEVLEVLVKEEDVNLIRSHIGYIKAAFRKLLKDESLADYESRIQKEGEHEDDSEEVTDVLSDRYEKALLIYKNKKAVYDQALEQQKQENLTVKERILDELRSLIESEEELKKTYDLFRELQDQWRHIGAVPQSSKNTLWNNYHFLVEKFFDKVKINKELKDLDLKKNLEAKTELCEKAEELLLESSITKSFQQLQKLHEAWKETGPVPKDKKDEIWERFKAATEKLNKRRQDYYDTLREEQNKNYSAKLVLCEKAEQLTAVIPESPKQWQNYTNQVNELFKMWKTIGFAPKKVNNEVWNRFRSSLDTFYKNKKDYFKKYKEHQTENYNQKLNLCLQAEALKDNEDWRATTEELIGLQKEWKKIGPVPAKFSDKIWKRFRAACDEFFNKKSDHFSNIGEKQEENLKKKLDLIEKVKNHNYTDDNNYNLKVLKDYQRDWMDIGHVPIKQKDKVQMAFRKVIDEQFESLNISKKAKNTLTFRSKLDNIKNAPNAESLIYKERNFIINKIATIQSDIKIWENNIGFFASSKKADILKAEFEEKIENGKQEIMILEEKLKILRES
jgi:hypothetical protein